MVGHASDCQCGSCGAATALRAAENQYLRAADSIDRLVAARNMGMTFAGARDTWTALGYPQAISLVDYRDRYRRGGVAGRVIDALPSAAWRGDGEVFEDLDPEVETAFETAWMDLNKQLKVWSTLQRAHILATLGSFSVILIGAPGDWITELPKGKPGGLLYLTPFGGPVIDPKSMQRGQSSTTGADVVVSKWDEDSGSPRFGQPLEYGLSRTNIASPDMQRPVHWSRVLHVPAPGFLDDAIFGPPGLERVFNYLIDLDKVVGGGSEAFWLRANAGIQFDIDKKMALTDANNAVTALAEQVDRYEHGMTRAIRTRGVNINQLGSDVADFSNPADVILTLIAGTCGIPKRILTGSEMGQLASTQDRNNWNDQVRDIRTSYAHPVILSPLIDRLIKYGYLPQPEQWEVAWPDSAAMTETEKIDAAKKAASLNDHGEIIITGAEIRETYLNLEPLDDDIAHPAKAAPPVVEDPDADPDPDAEPEDEADALAQERAAIDRLEVALRQGGAVDLVVRR